MTCSAASSQTAGFLSNSSTNLIGSVFVSSDSLFSSQGCDFGTGTTDNLPIDLSLGKAAGGYDDYSYGDNENFVCATDICGL